MSCLLFYANENNTFCSVITCAAREIFSNVQRGRNGCKTSSMLQVSYFFVTFLNGFWAVYCNSIRPISPPPFTHLPTPPPLYHPPLLLPSLRLPLHPHPKTLFSSFSPSSHFLPSSPLQNPPPLLWPLQLISFLPPRRRVLLPRPLSPPILLHAGSFLPMFPVYVLVILLLPPHNLPPLILLPPMNVQSE